MNANNFGSIPFIQGDPPRRLEPLSRYLPTIFDGVVSTWLTGNIAHGSWILDPFCASPKIAIEAARAGYRVLVTVNNPITRFLLEMMANPPKVEDLKTSLSTLSSSYIGNERIEPHIRALYNTTCARCGQVISADAFLWEHGNSSPYMRIYNCSFCGDSGEYPCTAYDVENADKFSSSGMHKARALERVISATDQDRDHVEQALGVYNPRALDGLITIINKISGLDITSGNRRNLSALLLYAFDQANVMWKVTGQKEKPRQLNIPRAYRENNIWSALEEGINVWSSDEQNVAIPITYWPALPPPGGGICLYEGRFVSIADSLKELDITSVITALPRPNQAFWTLSALWAGWLWGRDAITHFKSVLHRQRYDWSWHTNALSSVFTQLVSSLKQNIPILGLITDAETGFIGSVLISAAIAGCHLENIAMRKEQERAQIIWKISSIPDYSQPRSELSLAAINSAARYLEQRAEPANYLTSISAALIGALNVWEAITTKEMIDSKSKGQRSSGLDSTILPSEQLPSYLYTSVINIAKEALSYRSGFLQFSPQETAEFEPASKYQESQHTLFSLENQLDHDESAESEIPENQTGEVQPILEKEKSARSSDIPISTLIWLRQVNSSNIIPLTDRCELNLVDFLRTHPGCTFKDLDTYLCQIYTGLFSPSIDFIQICMDSYSTKSSAENPRWFLRLEDSAEQRRIDMENAEHIIFNIGKQLGCSPEYRITNQSRRYIALEDMAGNLDYRFFITSDAAISDLVLYGDQPAARAYIVIPGSRANIIFYKLRRDPRLGKAFNPTIGNWRFLKFRHLRSLAESPVLNRSSIEQLLSLDPLTYSMQQLWLI